MVISIMENLTVYNAKINVMCVLQNQIFVYPVTELIGLHGLRLIMIVSKYNFIKYLDVFMVISIIISLIAINANVNALLV